MTDIVKVDFTDGDKMEGSEISICPIWRRRGVRIKSMSLDTLSYEHVIVYSPLLGRSRLEIVDGCFRQKTRGYTIK